MTQQARPINVAINGFGRIGRNVLRAVYETGRASQVNIVAINELAEPEGIAHLLKYDTSHGKFGFDVKLDTDKNLLVENRKIELLCVKKLSELPWQQLNVDVVLDCTGIQALKK